MAFMAFCNSGSVFGWGSASFCCPRTTGEDSRRAARLRHTVSRGRAGCMKAPKSKDGCVVPAFYSEPAVAQVKSQAPQADSSHLCRLTMMPHSNTMPRANLALRPHYDQERTADELSLSRIELRRIDSARYLVFIRAADRANSAREAGRESGRKAERGKENARTPGRQGGADETFREDRRPGDQVHGDGGDDRNENGGGHAQGECLLHGVHAG